MRSSTHQPVAQPYELRTHTHAIPRICPQWELASQSFHPRNAPVWRNAHGIVAVFDTTNAQSLHDIAGLYDRFDADAMGVSVTQLLMGTKSDLTEQREVTLADAQALARARGVPIAEETSANSGVSSFAESAVIEAASEADADSS